MILGRQCMCIRQSVCIVQFHLLVFPLLWRTTGSIHTTITTCTSLFRKCHSWSIHSALGGRGGRGGRGGAYTYSHPLHLRTTSSDASTTPSNSERDPCPCRAVSSLSPLSSHPTRLYRLYSSGFHARYHHSVDQTGECAHNNWSKRDTTTTTYNTTTSRTPRKLLICGDGDLSFSASIAKQMALQNVQLTATVLESQTQHGNVYAGSQENVRHILDCGHHVRFEVDATKLENYFPSTNNNHTNCNHTNNNNNNEDDDRNDNSSIENNCDNHDKINHQTTALFDQIQFNFPHYPGKANNKYNRQLIRDFFMSASKVLKTTPQGGNHHNNGEAEQKEEEGAGSGFGSGVVTMALMNAQSGMESTTMTEWKLSWMPAMYAAYANLLLVDVQDFKPNYNLSSYRARDEEFMLKKPILLTFVAPSPPSLLPLQEDDALMRTAPPHLQLYCHFEVLLGNIAMEQVNMAGDVLLDYIANHHLVATGWTVRTQFVRRFDEEGLCAYKIALFGTAQPITKEDV